MKRIKTGIIGLGRIGRMGHISELLACPEQFEITAVADHAPDRLTGLPDALTDAKKYPDLESLLQDDDVEMITIGVRHADHVPMALKILAAGKIAVVEKPVATSTAEMDQLLEMGKKHPEKLFFRHNRRFEPAFVKVRQLIDSGIIGEVQYIKLYRSVGYCRRNDWLTMSEFYGGLLTNWGPHLIDQALRFLDSPVVDLWADVRHVISIGDGDDLFKILLKGANGRLADVEVTGANTMPGREMEIIGSRGTIVFDGGKTIDVRRIDPAVVLKKLAPHPENPPLKYGNFDETLYFVEEKYQIPDIPACEIWKHIWKSVVEHVPFPVTPEQAREVVRVTEEAFRKSGFPAPKGNS
ncbi:MAG: Gfo/Idh/MocA family oxidoreductase [Lentisphaeria bacterium]|nr:Gfo/Idh/MocA family oxidoreductase [Lentisphaeria bacterium]